MEREDGSGTVRFGAFRFDLDTLELRRRDRPLRLQRQPAKMLAFLLQRPGRLATREELADHLWGETHVDSDQGLNNAVRHLRSVLGDNAESPVYIETVPRMGYRFIAPLERVGQHTSGAPEAGVDSPPPRAQTNIWRWVGGMLLLAFPAVVWWMLQERSADTSPQAHPAYQEAMSLLSSQIWKDRKASLDAFQRTVELAPDFAPARLHWAQATWLTAEESGPLRELALQRLEQAMNLLPEAPEAHLLRAEIAFYHQWDTELADEHFARALQLGQGLKEVQQAVALYSAILGRFEAARRHAQLALDLDPSALRSYRVAGMVYLRSGDAQRAIELCSRVSEVSPAVDCLVGAYLARGDSEGALRTLTQWLPTSNPGAETLRRIEEASSPEEALERLLRWRFHLLSVESRGPVSSLPADRDRLLEMSVFGEISSPGRLAEAAIHAGGRDFALQQLTKAHLERSPSFLRWAGSPAFRPLFQRPDYLELIAASPLGAAGAAIAESLGQQ
ncbi:MAG TPA: winged helix-turn-helix domain-containing protein [Acidobacteriota bacterium]|nr:winged helix-turn-helix domain-containing protein [Acidobacteriota bacterium]